METTTVTLLAELEERVREGDTTVTAAMLAEARDAASFGELVIEGDLRAAATEAERVRRERIAELVAGITAGAPGGPSAAAAAVVEAYDAAVAALQRMADAATAYGDRVLVTFHELVALGPLPDDAGVQLPRNAGSTLQQWIARTADGATFHIDSRLAAHLAIGAMNRVIPYQQRNGLQFSPMNADASIDQLRAAAHSEVADDDEEN